jgi:FAD:protein FMN transferase
VRQANTQPLSRVISRLRIGFGTFVGIDAEAEDATLAELGIAAAFEALATIERVMHPTRAGSDLTLLAACPPGTHLSVHPWTWEVLAHCQQLNRASHGIFDPCLPLAVGRLRDLELCEQGGVRAHAPLRIDLGGIAKGFAVDRAIDALRAAGCEGGLVNAGGDLAVFGTQSRRIVCRATQGAGVVDLREAAMATSEVGEASRPGQHQGYYHGLSRRAARSGKVTVIAARAVIADALTKCLLFADHALGREMLATFGARELAHQKFSPSPRSKRLKSVFRSNH